jgi:zinc transport system substrate-binding protein
MDPHVWMSPPNAAIMVQNICHGLVQVDPDNRDYYETNRDAYVSELAALDADIREGLAGVSKRTFMVYHPSLGYFAAEYGLTMLSVEEGGKEPTGDLTRPIERAKENDITVVFTSPLSNPQPAEVIAAEIGGRVMFVDPLAADYVSNMRGFLASLIEALE